MPTQRDAINNEMENFMLRVVSLKDIVLDEKEERL
jgi:hypothetical protein